MTEFLITHWEAIAALASVPITYIFVGKAKQKNDAVSSMQLMYETFLVDYKDRMQEVICDNKEIKSANIALQKQFNEIHIQYSKEVEISQNWEKLHTQMKAAYLELQKQYEELKKDHDKLKKAFNDSNK